MNVRYQVELSQAEREEPTAMLSGSMPRANSSGPRLTRSRQGKYLDRLSDQTPLRGRQSRSGLEWYANSAIAPWR
jgi:hypothetical protein